MQSQHISNKLSKPLAIDLFAGAGGLTAGLVQAGYSVRGAIEYDPVAAESYRLNHPETVLRCADIREIPAKHFVRELGLQPGELMLLAGCPPCQGFSRMRTRNRAGAVADDRNSLVRDFVRFTRAFRPRFVMIENVPGLQSEPILRDTLMALKRLGYQSNVSVVDASDYGVPQRRKRLVVLAGLGVAPSMPRRARVRRSVFDAIGKLPKPGATGDELHDKVSNRAPHVAAIIRAVPKDGGSRAAVPLELLPDCHQAHDGHYDVYGRMAWTDVAPTITSGCHNPSRGRFIHPEQDRAISLREAALLQTFPRNYRFSMRRGREHAALQIGNALPPELIRRIARSLLEF